MNEKYLFLDRDGVINVDTGYLFKPKDLVFNPGIFDLVEQAVYKKYKIHIITNQSGIARGYFTEADLMIIMDIIIKFLKLKSKSITIDWSFSPFHEKGILEKYRIDSYTRKPNPMMINNVCNDLDILSKSIMIGDNFSDYLCSARAGLGTFVHFGNRPFNNRLIPFNTEYIYCNSLYKIIDKL